MDKKGCGGRISLREGATLSLVLSTLGGIAFFFLYEFSEKKPFKSANTLNSIFIVESVLFLGFSIVGLLGVYRRKVSFINACIYYLLIHMVFSVILPIIFALSYNSKLLITGFMIGFFLEFYFIYVINRYRKQLRTEEKEVAAIPLL